MSAASFVPVTVGNPGSKSDTTVPSGESSISAVRKNPGNRRAARAMHTTLRQGDSAMTRGRMSRLAAALRVLGVLAMLVSWWASSLDTFAGPVSSGSVVVERP
jgi:hypothetical protein